MRKERPVTYVEVAIDTIGFEGIAVGRVDGVVHFVEGALPGERVTARVKGKKKRFVEAVATEIHEPSAYRLEPPCPHFGACGGCKWQHFDYGEQCVWKRQHVIDAFERIGHVSVGEYRPTVACPQPYHYRNKMEFSFGASRWLTNEEIASGEIFETSFALGLHVPGRFDKVRHLDDCMLQSALANRILKTTHELAERYGIKAHHQRFHDGFARHLVIRTSVATGAVMAILVTTSPSDDAERAFIASWLDQHAGLPADSTLVAAVNDTRSPVAVGTIVEQRGPGYLEEDSHGIRYRISPFSFFQTNTVQLPNLVTRAIDAADIGSDDVVWDLYCGTGTLTLPAARRAKHVVGAELVASSIADARANAERNGIANVEFHTVDLHSAAATTLLDSFPKPDVLLVDPPRAGMHAMLVEHILRIDAPKVVYVSCNPATQARDCALLAENYDVRFVTPVDMFPQTFHVEAVALLERRTE